MLHRNIRGIGIALCLLTLLLSLSGCGSLKDDLLLIVNAVITEINTEKQTITVKDDADENTLGEECLIDCSSTPSDKATRDVLTKLCALFGLLDTTALDIRKAISAEISDFEDAVMVETAVRSGVDCIVTRNTKDYSKAPIPVYAPAEFIEPLTETSEDQPE